MRDVPFFRDVLLQAVDVVEMHEQDIRIAIDELHALLLRALYLYRFQPREPPDAFIHMNDEIATLELTQLAKGDTLERVALRSAGDTVAFKNLMLGVHAPTLIGENKPFGQRERLYMDSGRCSFFVRFFNKLIQTLCVFVGFGEHVNGIAVGDLRADIRRQLFDRAAEPWLRTRAEIYGGSFLRCERMCDVSEIIQLSSKLATVLFVLDLSQHKIRLIDEYDRIGGDEI